MERLTVEQINEAFEKFENLNQSGILRNTFAFLSFTDPPMAEVFAMAMFKNDHFSSDPKTLQRVRFMMGPNNETIYKMWQAKQNTFKGRIKSFFKKPCYFLAFILWFTGDMLNSVWYALSLRIKWWLS